MSKKILYLSRHGPTERNLRTEKTGRIHLPEWESVPGIDELTAEGREQPITVAKYLKQTFFRPKRVSPSNILIVTSTDNRSRDTGDIIRSALKVPDYNMLSFSTLCEEVPREYLMTLDIDDPTRNFISSARPKEEIGCDVVLTLEMIADQEPHKHIIAPLHGCINTLFLHYAGIKSKVMDNCSLIALEYDGKMFRVIDGYKTNDEMKRAIGARSVSEGDFP